MSKLSILHLSDIHFKKKEKEVCKRFREDVHNRMVDKIGEHIENNNRELDFVVVTGDIAFSGKEYGEAKTFFDKLKTKLPKKTIILPVPGNHDVDRGKISQILSLHSIVRDGKVDKFLESKERDFYINAKFNAFRDFVDELQPQLYDCEADENDYFWVKDYKGNNVSFLGLNSCWASENNDDDGCITLGYAQVSEALKRSKIDNRILLMHHPFDWFNKRDLGKYRGEIFNKCSLILHGHNHVDNALVQFDPSDSCICLGANASYTDEKDGFIGFQFITVEFKDKTTAVRVWPYTLDERTRPRFVKDRERWQGQDGNEYFDLETVDMSQKTGETVPPIDIPEVYREWIRQFHSTMDIDQLSKKGEVITVTLPEVYIPLETANPLFKAELEKLKKKEGDDVSTENIEELMKERKLKEPQKIDIEKLIGKENCVLLRGDAGMGKTTLVKHLAYTISEGTCFAGLGDYLPVIVFLKELWQVYDDQLRENKGKKVLFETLLGAYLKQSPCRLEMKIVENFLSRDRALFLFDGLDEVPERLRPDLIEMIADFRFTYSNNRFLLTGRRHGIEGKAAVRFGDYLHDIEYLDEKKVSDFITRWFRAVSGQATGLADVTSADMIADVKVHDHIAEFTRNPLLLTAVCVLYQDGKRIPEQRADLYERIVENLIYRRFHEPSQPDKENLVLEYLMLLSFTMQEKNLKTFDKGEARELLRDIFRQGNMSAPDYRRYIETLFEEIEPRCGLFNVLGRDEMEFTHLTFQEFLAAKHMVYMGLDYKKYLKEGWWQETLLLYIGLLSISLKKDSNEAVSFLVNTLPEGEKNRYRTWLLGAKAFRDFQPSKREETVVSIVREKLCKIMESQAEISERFEAGEIVGALGDLRLKDDNFVVVDDYKIGKYPVTNEEYKRFVADGGYEKKEFWSKDGWHWKEEEKVVEPRHWHDRKWNGTNFPVVGVSWYEASAYAKWLSKTTGEQYRLSTEAEWEKAARGTGDSKYPWGNEFDKNKCNSRESGLMRTSPVGIFPDGKSPYDCFDMSGNVWEWCADLYSEGGSIRVLRGGSWNNDARNVRCAIRSRYEPTGRYYDLGFRLCQDT